MSHFTNPVTDLQSPYLPSYPHEMNPMSVIQNIGILHIGFGFPQLHYDPNGTLIMIATEGVLVLRNGMNCIGVGCSTSPPNQEVNYPVMLWEAQQAAIQKAAYCASISIALNAGNLMPSFLCNSQGFPVGHNALPVAQDIPVLNGAEHGNVDKNKFQGGGDKPSSSSQRQTIMSMCNERTMDCNELCIGQCGKGLDNLSGADANTIIKYLKSPSNSRNKPKQ